MYVDDEFVRKYDKLIADRINRAKVPEDKFDEVRAEIYRRILSSDNYDPEKGAVSTWVHMICRSVISNMARKQAASRDALDHATDLGVARNKIGREDAGELSDELKRIFEVTNLSIRDINIVKDVHLNGYTMLEAAEKYRMKYYAVQKVVSRALKALRNAVKTEETK